MTCFPLDFCGTWIFFANMGIAPCWQLKNAAGSVMILEPLPALTGQEEGYDLHRYPVCRRANKENKQPFTLSHLQPI